MSTSQLPDATSATVPEPTSTDTDTRGAPLTQDGDLLTNLGARLIAGAELAAAQARAISTGQIDELAALETRREAVRTELQVLGQALAATGTALAPAIAQLIRELTSHAATADGLVTQALQQQGAASVRELLGRGGWITPAQQAALLAPPWDQARDLLLLIGVGSAALSERLAQAGQRRIVSVDPSQPATPSGRSEISTSRFNLHDLQAIESFGVRLSDPRPEQMRVHVCSDQAPASVEAIAAAAQRGLVTAAHYKHDVGAGIPYYAEMAVRNLAQLAALPSVARLRGIFAGTPAVVVAAGPSLDKNIHSLHKLAGRAVIIAISQTVKALVKAGIQPDVVLAVDPLRIQYHFEGLPPNALQTLVLGAGVDPDLFALPARTKVTFSSSPPAEGWAYELMGEAEAKLGSAGTVGNAGLKLAAWLGCDPIVSIGRDLAMDGQKYYADVAIDGGEAPKLTDGGKKITFAGNGKKMRLTGGVESPAVVREMLERQELRLCSVPGFFGQPVTTTDMFVYELGLVQSTLRELAGQARFINATEGGAYLHGMEHTTLESVIAGCTSPTVDIQDRMAAALFGHDGPARQRRLHTGLQALLVDLRRVVQTATRAEALLDAKGAAQREYRKVRQALAEQSRTRLMISVLVQAAVNDLLDPRSAAGSLSADQVRAQERALYKAIQGNVGAIADGIASQLPLMAAATAVA